MKKSRAARRGLEILKRSVVLATFVHGRGEASLPAFRRVPRTDRHVIRLGVLAATHTKQEKHQGH